MTIIIEKATIKMKKLLKYILLLIYVALMPACGEDSGLDGVFANKPFALVTAADGGRTSISAVIDDGKRTIRLTFDKKRDVDAVELTFQLNPGYAMVSPKEPETTMDLTQPRTVTVSSGAGEVSYEISARNETPVLSASFLFRGKPIEGVIDHETRTVSFPITTIYASEYPEELLGAVPLDITLSDGYRPTSEKVSYDLSTGESFSVYKGRNTYTYRLVADIAPIPVADHLSDFRFRRGVNLAYWMTEADRDWLGYVMPAQFPLWKELGFDHFRVPVDELCIFDREGQFNEKAVGKLHELFTWCEQNGMYAILDMHTLAPREGSDSYREEELYDPAYPEFRTHFVNVWRKLAAEFKAHNPKCVAFELLNEPHDGTPDATGWNKLQNEVLTAVREQDPERIVFVPAMGWQDYNYIKYARVAEEDPNAVVSFHYYLPMLLSHYKMLAWVGYQGAVQYPGVVIPTQSDADKYPQYASFHKTTYNADRIMGEMSNAASDGRNAGLAVHCGEFGCSKNVAEAMRLAWFTDMVAAMEANNIPWTLWECLDGGFGFVDMEYGIYRINCPLLKVLTGKGLTDAEAKVLLQKYGFKTE